MPKKKAKIPSYLANLVTKQYLDKRMRLMATKKDLDERTGLIRRDFKKVLDERTNLIIGELSRDIRNGDETILRAIETLANDLKPRMTTLENKQDIQEQRLDNHEKRLVKLEA